MGSLGTMTTWQNRIVGYEEVDPESLVASPGNWRVHPKFQQDALLGVLQEVGVVQDVIVSKNSGFVVDGHLRVTLALRTGQPTIPVKYVDLSEGEEALVLATLDPISALATADAQKLDELLADVRTGEAAVQEMLAGLAESAGLYADKPAGAGGDDFDTTPQEGPTRTQQGDLWRLGDHRLVVGDSTERAVVERLMGSESPRAIITDPPYGFGLASTSKRASKAGDWHDMMNNASWYADRYRAWLTMMQRGPVWMFCNWRTLPILMKGIFDAGVSIEDVMVWYKDWIGPGGMRGLRPTYELITLSLFGDYGIPHRGVEDFIKVGWSSHKPSGHKAEKPIELLTYLVNTSDVELVLDPFAGSGTTLIACERTGRKARLVEIEPRYADVCLRRWEAETGREAELVERLELSIFSS